MNGKLLRNSSRLACSSSYTQWEKILIQRKSFVKDVRCQLFDCMKPVALTMVLCSVPLTEHVQAQTSSGGTLNKRPISVTDDIQMTRLEERDYFSESRSIVHFSPDGRLFVVVLRKGDVERNTNESSLLLYSTAEAFRSPKPDFLLKMSSSSDRNAITKVRWLPDNKTLVFLGENPGETSQIYEFNVQTRELKKLTNHQTVIMSYDISSDGRAILFIADPPERQAACTEQGSCGEIVIAGQGLPDILAGNYSQWEGRQVFCQTVGDSPRQVPVGAKHLVAPWWPTSFSPDGRYVAIPASIRDIPPEWRNYENESLQEIFAANFPKGKMSPLKQYLLFDIANGSLVSLIDAPMIGFDPVSWAKDGKSVFLSSYLPLDVAEPAERKARQQSKYLIEIRLASREFRKVSKEAFPHKIIEESPIDVSISQDLNTPPKLYVWDRQSQKKALLLDLNPQFSQLNFGVVKTIVWKVDGIEVIGGLYLPTNYTPGKRYSLVIQTHGFNPNEFSMDGISEWSSAYAARPLAAKGIIVLQSEEFKNPEDHNRIRDDRNLGATGQESFRSFAVHAWHEAIDYLDKQGLIDTTRVGISGFSRTVCFVGYALTHSTHRFAAASLVDGISCGYFEEIALPEEAWDVNSLNGGSAPFNGGLKLWMKNAPGFNLDMVRTPVRLVALGNYSVLSSWEWYVGLTLQNKPVGVKMSQRFLTQQGIVDWFDFWLQGNEDPSPSKHDQYARWRELRKQYSSVTPAVQ